MRKPSLTAVCGWCTGNGAGTGNGENAAVAGFVRGVAAPAGAGSPRVATSLELYCTGSLNLFNHPTNVDLNSRVVCIVLKGLGENLRKIAMHTTNEFVTAAVNRQPQGRNRYMVLL